jgi:glutamate dehydrogenase
MGSVSATSKKQIRAYFVSQCNFVNPNPSLEEMRDIRVCSDKTFLEKVTENTLDIYQSVVDAVLQRSGMTSTTLSSSLLWLGEETDGV